MKLPVDWKHCPRKGELINIGSSGFFLPFKTPLDESFRNLDRDELFTPQMFIKSQEEARLQIGLWIDLTNTNRYYDERIVKRAGIKYFKLKCEGQCPPTFKNVSTFIKICKDFLLKTPSAIICVHCTHGFNRTGFLICSYLIEELRWSVEAAIQEFIRSRQPGIYKQKYIDELYKRYESEKEPCEAPSKPLWVIKNVTDNSNVFVNNSHSSYSRKIIENSNKLKFMDGLPGFKVVSELEKIRALRYKIRKLCYFDKNAFPGSQPVNMCNENKFFITRTPYQISLQSNGTRCMMLIVDANEIYFFDRYNNVFQVVERCPKFPRRSKPNEHLKTTLLDGEMIINNSRGLNIPTYLINDIIAIDGKDVGQMSFDIRSTCIEKEIIFSREKGKTSGLVNHDLELFEIRKKDFYDLKMIEKLLEPNFTDNIAHVEGLIFQPINKSYTVGRCFSTLKWEPPACNSVNFRVRIFDHNERGCQTQTKKVALLVGKGRREEIFSVVTATKDFTDNDGKIVECTYENELKMWKFIKARMDESQPNSCYTAMIAYETMINPLNKENLIDFVNKNMYKDKDKKRFH